MCGWVSLQRLGITTDCLCKACADLCPELAENGRRVLGRKFSEGLEDVADVDLVHLRKFAQGWKCYTPERKSTVSLE